MAAEDQGLEERRRARLEHLEGRQPHRDAGVLGGERALEDEDALRHPDPQRHLVAAAAQDRLRQMDVAVDETGRDDPAVQVAHGLVGEAGANLAGLAHRGDRVALDDDRGIAQDAPLGVHGHDRAVVEQHPLHPSLRPGPLSSDGPLGLGVRRPAGRRTRRR